MSNQIIPTQSPASETEAFHKSFSWVRSQHRGDKHAQFYALTVDVCQGIATSIDLAHFSNTDRDNGTMPTLDIKDTEHLLRLALASSYMLAEMAAARIDKINDHN